MPHVLPIGEREVEIAWTRETALRYQFRAASHGVPTRKELTSPRSAAAAITRLLWLVLPAAELDRYPTPEDLFVALDHENHGERIHAAVVGIVGDMNPTDEKKSSSGSTPSPASNSECPPESGTASTP